LSTQSDVVAKVLTKAGARVICPYLRGFGPSQFLSPTTIRSGQQAALASDLIALLDRLHIRQVVLAGFDRGGSASCTAAALIIDRVAGLVGSSGFDVLDVEAGQRSTDLPSTEKVMWYPNLFPHQRGKECLTLDRLV